ncbi:MAG: hypothetical protein JWN63_634 [Candidatus Acidoferrum typicum]|nr:hypothetical protein [Candidatus Acidoferrum typicum]
MPSHNGARQYSQRRTDHCGYPKGSAVALSESEMQERNLRK